MSVISKPILAATFKNDWDKLIFPVYGTTKLDGIRSISLSGKLVSRTFKTIQNKSIRETLETILPKDKDSDGELLAILETGEIANFQQTTHAVMERTETPVFKYYMFDLVEQLDTPYLTRMENMKIWYETLAPEHKEIIQLVLPTKLNNREEVEAFEQKCLDDGFEGIILRNNGKYKCGRSTINEQYLIKIKRFEDSEALVEGFEEMEQNCNVATTNVFGRTERSSHKDNMVGKNTLGCLVARDIHTNIEIKIGSGFNDEQRKEVWNNKEKYIGQLAKYKFFAFGVKEKSRHPIFLGWRNESDTGFGE